jgi:mono/diheme cytochrome c family protein
MGAVSQNRNLSIVTGLIRFKSNGESESSAVKIVSKLGIDLLAIVVVAIFLIEVTLRADDAKFHNAPDEVIGLKNPYAGQAAAAEAGGKLYAANCAICHGQSGQGTGEIPALMRGPAQAATDGEVFWFITTGSLNSGMPSWQKLPEKERWELVTFVKSLPTTRRAPPKRHVVAACGPRRKHHFAGAAKAFHGLPFRRAWRQPKNYRRGFARGACDEVC